MTTRAAPCCWATLGASARVAPRAPKAGDLLGLGAPRGPEAAEQSQFASTEAQLAAEEESQLPRWSRGRLSGAGRHSRLLTAAGLCILVLFALLPVWVVEYFPSQDGPNHLLIAEGWSHYDEADADLSRAYFALNPHIEPNLAVYPLLALFGHLTDPATAEKLLVSLVVILWAMAGVYAVASVDRQAWPLSLLLVPIIFGYHLHMGYYNFVLSLSGFVFVFGY